MIAISHNPNIVILNNLTLSNTGTSNTRPSNSACNQKVPKISEFFLKKSKNLFKKTKIKPKGIINPLFVLNSFLQMHNFINLLKLRPANYFHSANAAPRTLKLLECGTPTSLSLRPGSMLIIRDSLFRPSRTPPPPPFGIWCHFYSPPPSLL